jgi:hypothetical protein
MLRVATAVRYDRDAEAGRNRPLRVTAEVDDEEIDVFLKPSGRPELSVTGLAHEVIAACVAGRLGLPICEPLLVEMTPEWIASVHDAATRYVLERSSRIAFGSRAAGVGWRQWSSDDVLTTGRRQKALEIFAFDAFIENPDRKPSNPNLLVKGDEFRIIDHELALFVRGLLPRSEPWREGYLSRLMEADRHVFAPRLRGADIDIQPVGAAWRELSDDDLADYEACLPEQWAEASDSVSAALNHLRTIRDRMDECLAEIGRALT